MSKADEMFEKYSTKKLKEYIWLKQFTMTEAEYWRERYYGNIK